MIILTFILLILLVLFPKDVSLGVSQSINMCLTSVIPSLFPFMIASNLILNINSRKNILTNPLSLIFKISPACSRALILGLICGYPIGGKNLIELHHKGIVSEKELSRALPFANNSGLGFMTGIVGGVFFNDIKIGFLMFLSHILASLTYGFLTSFFYKAPRSPLPTAFKYEDNLLIKSIKGAVEGSLNIMGVISFFSVIITLLELIPFINSFSYKGLLYGILEITNGVKFIALSPLSLRLRCALSSFIITFSGISVFLQLKCFSPKINTASYFFGKMLCGAFAFIYCCLLI